jgi:hypothetical protein
VVEVVLFGAAIVSVLLLWEFMFSNSQSGPALPEWASGNKVKANVKTAGSSSEAAPLTA